MGFLYTPLPFWVAVGGWIATAIVVALALWKNPFKRLQDGTLQALLAHSTDTATMIASQTCWSSRCSTGDSR